MTKRASRAQRFIPRPGGKNPEWCVVAVLDANRIPWQCNQPRGHGLSGEYCKRHAKAHPAEPTSPAT